MSWPSAREKDSRSFGEANAHEKSFSLATTIISEEENGNEDHRSATGSSQATPAGSRVSIAQRRSAKQTSSAPPPVLAATSNLGPSFHQHKELTSPTFTPSAPINIAVPRRRPDADRPTTPLTGRIDENCGHHFPFPDHTPPRPQVDASLKTRYSFQPKTTKPADDNSQSLGAKRTPWAMQNEREASRLYAPSPQLPLAMPYPRNSHPAEQGLQLPSLPRFHPANYQNSNGGPLTAPSMPRPPSSPRSPRPHHRQVSQAQQKLLQYQRELVINATRASRSIISQAPGSNPTSPKLLPLGSPGPVTPLMLGDQDDYLIAGARASRSPLGEGSPHELVDRLIDDEGEMKRYSSAHSGQNSPVVGPAGGPG